jgi:hypothetical protein
MVGHLAGRAAVAALPEGVRGDVAAGSPDADADAESFDDEIDRLTRVSGGALDCFLADREALTALALARRCGDGFAAGLLEAVAPLLAEVEAARSAGVSRLRCLCCDEVWFCRGRGPAILAVLMAEDPAGAWRSAVTAGVCRRCAGGAGWPGPGWKTGILDALTPAAQRLWPGARFFAPIPGAAGRA